MSHKFKQDYIGMGNLTIFSLLESLYIRWPSCILPTSKGKGAAFPTLSPSSNVVPLYELPVTNNKHPKFEWRAKGRGADCFALRSTPIKDSVSTILLLTVASSILSLLY